MSNKTTLFVTIIVIFVMNMTLKASPSNFTLDFDGNDDYVSVNKALLNNLNNWTFSCWVYPQGNSDMMIYSEGSPKVTFEMSLTGSNKLHVGIWNKHHTNNWYHFYTSANSVPANQWTHIAVTLSGAGDNASLGDIKIYLNGDLVQSNQSFRQEDDETRFLNIGRNVGSTHDGGQSISSFRGKIDLMQISNLAASQQQIKVNMFKEISGEYSGLLAFWNFNDSTGTTLKDASSNNNDGTLNNIDNSAWIKSTSPISIFPDNYSEPASIWAGKLSNPSGEMSVSIRNTKGDGYISIAHSSGNYSFENSSIPNIEKQNERTWVMNKLDAIQFITLRFNLSGEYDSDKLCVIISTSEDFSTDLNIWEGKKPTDSDTSYFESTLFLSEDSDTYYCTIAETNSSNVLISATKGYGPFLETYDNENTFTIDNLPEDVNEVIFYFLHQDGSTIDSVDVTGSSMSSASCNYEMGILPQGTHLFVKVIVSGDQQYVLNFHEYITITPISPHIYVSAPDSSGFFYEIGDDVEKTFFVDSLPKSTSKVRFELLDGNKNPIPGAIDSTVGEDITIAQWHVNMIDFDITLSSVLRVTVFHKDGFAEGASYIAPLEVYAPASEFSVSSFTKSILQINYFGQLEAYLTAEKSFLNKKDDWTFSAWIKPWDYGDEHTTKYFYSEGNPQQTFHVYITSNNSLGVGIWNQDHIDHPIDKWINVYTGHNKVPDNEWTHVAITLSGAGSNGKQGTLKIYINGELEKEADCHRLDNNDNKYLAVGRNVGSLHGGNQDSIPFRGYFDEIRIYNKELSQSEIKEKMWKQEYDLNYMLAYWRFNDVSDKIKCEVSSNNDLDFINCTPSPKWYFKEDDDLRLLTQDQTEWGPLVTNNYNLSGGVHNGNWLTKRPYYNQFTLKGLPPKTSKVSFKVIGDDGSNIHTHDISAPYNTWLDSASYSVKMTNLPLATRKLEADVFCIGGNDNGITNSHDLIVTQRPLKITKQQSDTLYAHRKMDKSLKFQGGDESRINIMADSIDIGSEFTIEFWVKMMNYPDQTNEPVWFLGTSPRMGFNKDQWNNYYPVAEIKTVDGSIIEMMTEERSIWKGWVHYALVSDGSHITLYVGEKNIEWKVYPEKIDSNPYFDLSSLGYSGNLDGSSYGHGIPIEGFIDEIRIWNKARTHNEIKNTRYTSLTKEDGLVLNWTNNGLLTNKSVVFDESFSGTLGRINQGVTFSSDTPPLDNYIEEFVVQSSNIETDTVYFDWLDKLGNILKTDKTKYMAASDYYDDYSIYPDSLIAPVKHDLAEFPYTINRIAINATYPDKNVIKDYDTVFNLVIYPAEPYVNPTNGWSNFVHGAEVWNHFHISGFPDGTDKVVATIKNASTGETYDSKTLQSNAIPFKNSLQLNNNAIITTTESYDNPNPFSFMLWFKTSTTKGGKLIGLSNNSNGYGNVHDRQLYMDNDGKLHFGVWGDKGVKIISSQYQYNDGLWHHVAVTYHNESMAMYVDGGVVDMTSEDISVGNYSGYWSIGGGILTSDWPSNPTSEHFAGEITEVSIWNVLISYRTISEFMYNRMNPDHHGSLVNYYKCNEGTGTTLTDVKSGNNGTIDGETKWIINNEFVNPVWSMNMGDFPVGEYNFYTTIFYPEGPDESHEYLIDKLKVSSPWETSDSDNITLESSRGFGYSIEGSKAVYYFTLNSDFTYSHDKFEVKLKAGKFNSSEVLDSKSVSFDSWPVHFTMDMGEAEPGSQLWIELTGKPIAKYPLFVEPIGIPKVTGNTGPFDQSIAPNTMEHNNTFKIISYADDLSKITADFKDSYGNDMGSTNAVQVDDTTWTVTYDMAKLWPPETKMILSYYIGNDTEPALVQSDIHIKINRTRPFFIYRWSDYSDISEVGDTVFYTVKTPFDKSKRSDIAEMTATLPMFDGQKLLFKVPDMTANLQYIKSTKTLSFVDDPEISYSANILGGGKKNDEFDLVNENALCDGCYYYLLQDGPFKNELEAYRFKRIHHSFELPIFFYYDLIKDIKELVSDAADVSPLSLIAKPYWDFSLGFEWGSDFQTHVGMDEHGYWGSVGGLDPVEDDGDSTSHQYGVFGSNVSFTIGIEFCLGIIGSIEVNLEGGYLFGLGDIHHSAGTYHNKTLKSEEVKLAISITAHELFGIFEEYIMHPKTIARWHGGDEIPENWPKVNVKALGHRITGIKKDDKNDSPLVDAEIQEIKYINKCNPQPAVSSNKSEVVSAWLEQDEHSGVGTLLVSKFDSTKKKFSTPLIIVSNRNAISNPRVDLISGATAVITWSQNRYSKETAPYNATINDLLKGHDIWFAIYDLNEDIIKQVSVIPDDYSDYMTGRMEGMADIAVLSDDKALITWIVADLDNSESVLWYALLENVDGTWSVTVSAKISDIDGIQSMPRLARFDDGEAVMVWINMENSDEINGRIMSSVWDGYYWTIPEVINDNQEGKYLKDIDLDFSEEFGIATWTSYKAFGEGGDQLLEIAEWDPEVKNWDYNPYIITDSLCSIQNTKSSISTNGIAAVIYKQNLKDPVTKELYSKLNLLTKDLKNEGSDWFLHSASNIICDTNTVVKSLDATFGKDNILFIKSQELHNNKFNFHYPKNGILFGMPEMRCVLRVVQINQNLTLTDIDENDIVSDVNDRAKENYYTGDIYLEQNIPNPFSDNTRISFKLMNPMSVKLEISDVTGNMISVPFEGFMEKGTHTIEFSSEGLSNGMYFYKLTAGESILTRSMIVIK
jgi:hypothetical protein